MAGLPKLFDASELVHDIPKWEHNLVHHIVSIEYRQGHKSLTIDLTTLAQRIHEPPPNRMLMGVLIRICREHRFVATHEMWVLTIKWGTSEQPAAATPSPAATPPAAASTSTSIPSQTLATPPAAAPKTASTPLATLPNPAPRPMTAPKPTSTPAPIAPPPLATVPPTPRLIPIPLPPSTPSHAPLPLPIPLPLPWPPSLLKDPSVALAPDLELAALLKNRSVSLPKNVALPMSHLAISDNELTETLNREPFVIFELPDRPGEFLTLSNPNSLLVALGHDMTKSFGRLYRDVASNPIGFDACLVHRLPLDAIRVATTILGVKHNGHVLTHIEGIRRLVNGVTERRERDKRARTRAGKARVRHAARSAARPMATQGVIDLVTDEPDDEEPGRLVNVDEIVAWDYSSDPSRTIIFKIMPNNTWQPWTGLCEWVEGETDETSEWHVTDSLYPFVKQHARLKHELEQLADKLHPGKSLWEEEEEKTPRKKRSREGDEPTGEPATKKPCIANIVS